MTDLTETDMTAVASAVRILNEAGIDVSEADDAQRADQGVTFTLECYAPTKGRGTMEQIQAVKEAALAAPEYDFAGEVIEDAG